MQYEYRKNIVQGAPEVELMEGWISCACVIHAHARTHTHTYAHTTHTYARASDCAWVHALERLCMGACTRARCGPRERFDFGTFFL